MHPAAKKKWNQMIKTPEPLAFKLHPWPPAHLKERGHEAQAKDPHMTPFFKNVFTPLNEPLGRLENLPFEVQRTEKGNLPVYTDFRAGGLRKVTVVRRILGDVEQFKAELAKICSNATIVEKMGRLEISGLHTQKVKLWLTRLGF